MTSLRVVLRVPRRDSPSPEVATSGADDSLSDDMGCHVPSQRTSVAKKKRKSSYHARKAAMTALRTREQTLRRQLQQIQADRYDHPETLLQRALHENGTLKTRVGVNRLTIATVQALTTSVKTQITISPLSDYIHLPCDVNARRQVLSDLRPRKLNEATKFLLARMQSHNLRCRTHQVETFQTEDGDHIVLDWGVVKFEQPGLSSRMVYDAVIDFSRSHEMTLADKLGLITIRESESYVSTADMAEVRMLLTRDPNILIEKNGAYYTQFVARSELLDQPHGLIVCDYIDQDDLYPYQPLARIRKDISSATMVLQCPPLTTSPDEVPAVVVVQWSYGCIHKSPLATEDQLESIAREGVFFDVMVQDVRERLAWKASEQSDST